MVDNELLDLNDLEKEIDEIKKESTKNTCIDENKEEKKYKIVTTQREYLRIKFGGIITSLFLKLLYKIIFLGILFVSLKVEVIKQFILSFYFAHYLFFLMFILLTIDIIFFLIKFTSDVQEILLDNIYIETVTKQEKIPLST